MLTSQCAAAASVDRSTLSGRIVVSASTTDPRRRTRLLTNLGSFDLGSEGAKLVGRHPWAEPETIAENTGFAFTSTDPLPVTSTPDLEFMDAIRAIDSQNLSQGIVG